MRTEIKSYPDGELAVLFDNTEVLYQCRYMTWVDTIEEALDRYIFTDAQLDELKEWWDGYQEEEE